MKRRFDPLWAIKAAFVILAVYIIIMNIFFVKMSINYEKLLTMYEWEISKDER